jgi:alanine racemase
MSRRGLFSPAPDHSTELYRPTFAEVDLDAYDRNIAAVRARLPEGSRVIAVLKADGYGHGLAELARRCEAGGVAMIAVALLEEALQVTAAGVRLPVLILGALTPPQIELAVRRRYVMGVVGPEALRDVCEFSRRTRRKCRIHLKLDSGMGRMGLIPDDLALAVNLLRKSPRVEVQAIYTHYAAASDPAHPLTEVQRDTFALMLGMLSAAGIEAPAHHSANSAAVMRGLVAPGDFVRVGLSLLGAEPLDRGHSRLEPVLSLRSEIARLKTLPSGSSIGYGATFTTARESSIATVPVGYADGYDRGLSNNGEVLVRGRRCPVVGRVSMDLITVDVTDAGEAAVGDPVILLGRDGGQEISAEELAGRTSTIPYEVFCRVSARVPRLYRSGGAYWIHSKFRT